MTTLRVGVAGVGHLGRIHAKLWKEVDGVQFCGVYDENQAAASAVANDLKTENYATLDHLLTAVDALSIVTTTQAHHAVAERAILYGKHVLIEKPITTTTRSEERRVGKE